MYLGLHDPLERVKRGKKTLEDLLKVDRVFFPPLVLMLGNLPSVKLFDSHFYFI
jgi:hypothetical protein